MTIGIILGAAYMLYLYARVVYGKSVNTDAAAMPDLNAREIGILVAAAIPVLWMGIYPASFLKPLHAPVGAILARVQRAAPPSQTIRFGAPAPAAPAPAAAAH